MLGFLKKNFLLILILLFSATVISTNINKPFIGHHDWNSAWHAIAAKNMARYGLLETRFASVMNSYQTEKSNFVYFTHYPPLVPIIIFLSFKIFGIHDWSTRIVPIAFSLAGTLLIYILTSKIFNKRTAILAATISASLPIVIYFSLVPTHDLMAIPFVLLSIYFYFNFYKFPTLSNFFKLISSLVISHLAHWSGYYVTPLFFLHYLFFSESKNRPPQLTKGSSLLPAQDTLYRPSNNMQSSSRPGGTSGQKSQGFFARNYKLIALSFPIASLLMFSFHLSHLVWLTGNPFGGGLLEILLGRMNLKEKPIGYSELNFLILELRLLVAYFTRPVLILSALTFSWLLIRLLTRKFSQQASFLTILLVIGLIPILIFRNLAYVHDFIIISLWPFLAISAAVGFFLLVEKSKYLKKVQFPAAIILVLIIFLDRLTFTKALIASSAFAPGVILGQQINALTTPQENAIILSNDYQQYLGVFTSYYADRFIDYNLITDSNLQKSIESGKYALIIATPNRDTPKSQLMLLQKNLKEIKIDEFLIYRIAK